jgi:hypothetical protein
MKSITMKGRMPDPKNPQDEGEAGTQLIGGRVYHAGRTYAVVDRPPAKEDVEILGHHATVFLARGQAVKSGDWPDDAPAPAADDGGAGDGVVGDGE